MAIRQVIAYATKSMGTTSTDDYDPARVVGYGILAIGATVYFGLSIYDTIVNQKFNYDGFMMGLLGIAAAIPATAAGVSIKRNTERPFEELQKAKTEANTKDEATESATPERTD